MAVNSLNTIFSAVESREKKNEESSRMKRVKKELAIDTSYRVIEEGRGEKHDYYSRKIT